VFAEIERRGDRRSRAYTEKTRQLARLLNLVPQWWTMNHVNDRSAKPCHPEGHVSRDDFWACRRTHEALLAALTEQDRRSR